ncbi:hypothetical protein SAZ11_22085 [Streptomyces sp. FXJ1.4098]|nr:hypothetical protein [Streptomyces sp. FXJ1.4098]
MADVDKPLFPMPPPDEQALRAIDSTVPMGTLDAACREVAGS